MNIILGSHISFNKDDQLVGVVNNAIDEGANAFMFYTGSSQSTQRFQLNDRLTIEAYNIMNDKGIDPKMCIVHAPYIVNLANNSDPLKYNFYISFLRQEIDRCNELGIMNLVFHPGSYVKLTKEEGIKNTSEGISLVLKDKEINLLIEYMAGKGTEVGTSIDELKAIYDGIDSGEKQKVFFCIDTCHMNDSGVDISKFDEFLDEFDKKIGIDKIKCVHLNDSQNDKGSHKDRHANIGYGTIGFNNLVDVLYNERLKNIPKILETPFRNGKAPYKEEIEMLKKKEFKELD